MGPDTLEITRQQRRMAERDSEKLQREFQGLLAEIVREAISPALMDRHEKGATLGEARVLHDLGRDTYHFEATLRLEEEVEITGRALATREFLVDARAPGAAMTEILRQLSLRLLEEADTHYGRPTSPIYSEYDHEAGF